MKENKKLKTESSPKVVAEDMFRLIADFTYDWETWINPEGEYLYCSPSCFRITGYEASEFMSDNGLFSRIIHPADRKIFKNHFSFQQLNTRESCNEEFRITTKDGNVRWIGHLCQPIITPDGSFLGRRGSNRDITASKEAQFELERNKTLLDQTGRLARVGGWELDLNKDSLLWSDATYDIHEVERSFVPDLGSAIKFYTPEAIPVITKCVEEAIKKGRSFDVELQIVTAKGKTLWVRALGEAFWENGKVARVSGVFQDIDKEKEAALKLNLSRQKLELHAKNTPLGVIEFDIEGIITEWNLAAESIFGFSKEEAIGSNWYIIAPKRYLSKLEGVWESIVEQKGGTRSLNENMTKEGEVIFCDWFNTPLINEEGQTIGVASLVQDVTERLRTEEELKKHRNHLKKLVRERTKELNSAIKNLTRSNQELESFAYVASHDLQEPLRMVASYTQLLEKRYKDKLDQDARDFIYYAVDGANRMQRLINDLLQYSRVTTKGKPFAKVDLTSALGHAVANLQAKISESGAIIVNNDLPVVDADEGQIVRVFQNLIDNGIKFSSTDSPRIMIESQLSGKMVRISIRDNGIGIDPVYSDRVFTIFQRLHTKQEYPGTGIGLAICKRIVERHGGTIWFESKEGEGTTFYFTLKTNKR